jgi:hypothetical protein
VSRSRSPTLQGFYGGCAAQRAPVITPPGEEKVTQLPAVGIGDPIRLKRALRSTREPATSVAGRALARSGLFSYLSFNFSPAVSRGFFYVAFTDIRSGPSAIW